VDFDGDGLLDLITEESDFFRGGIRETLARFMAARRVGHCFRVYRQLPGGFEEQPALEHRVTLELDGPPIEHGSMFSRIEAGDVLNPVGDFDGDGYKDIVVHDGAGRASIYLANEFSYSPAASATLSFSKSGKLDIADVDGDGRDDIIVRWTEPATRAISAGVWTGSTDESGDVLCTVYFSRESTP
jgi:hypothetical protein